MSCVPYDFSLAERLGGVETLKALINGIQ